MVLKLSVSFIKKFKLKSVYTIEKIVPFVNTDKLPAILTYFENSNLKSCQFDIISIYFLFLKYYCTFDIEKLILQS